MKKSKLVSGFLFIVAFQAALAQPKIAFDKTAHDFGKIAEGTAVSFDFVFENAGDQPLTIGNVAASCGCTTPFWTKEPVLPGAKGVISVSYNSQGRPGAFYKTISVISNGNPQYARLEIRGEAVRDDSKIYTQEQLNSSPKIIFERSSISLGNVEKSKSYPVAVKVYNSGLDDLVISGIHSSCNCIAWNRRESTPLKRGESLVLELIYSPKTLGERKEVLFIHSNDLSNGEAKIEILAVVVESLAPRSVIRQNNMTTF